MHNSRNGCISLVGLILVLGVVCFLVLKMMNVYVHKPVVDEGIKQMMAGRNSGGRGYDAVLDNIENQVGEINKKAVQREKELEDIF